MGCDVCIGGDADQCDFTYFNVGDEILTQPAKCAECGKVLNVGETHQYASSHDSKEDAEDNEAEFHEAWTCSVCAEIRKVFSCGETEMFGSLWGDMAEHAFPNLTTASKCFTNLSAEAKAAVLKEWREWKGIA